MSAGRSKERPRLIPSHENAHSKVPSMSNSSNRLYQGEAFSQQYGLMQPKPRTIPYELSQSSDGRVTQDLYDHNRRVTGHVPGPLGHHQHHPRDRLEIHLPRDRSHPSRFSENMDTSVEKRSTPLRPPPIEPSMIAPLPKKARYHEAARVGAGGASWNQPLRIDTTLDANKMKMELPGGYHPETEAISPTLPTESHDSKSDIVHSINEVDREINLIENQIQQLQKKQIKLEAEAAKPKEDIPDDDSAESKPLSIAQIVYKENMRHAHKSHNLLSKLKYTEGSAAPDLPLFHQPSDTQVYHENVQKFAMFKSVLQSYFKKKALERARTERYWEENYESLVTNWLKKVDAKTIKKNIKDIKTREYYEKVFPEIKKHREDKERITSRVGARGVSSGYARTEAEFEQIVDGITEQEEEDKKMRAYAIIPPMLNQTQRKLKFMNRNGLIAEPMSEYKERKLTTSWSTEEKAFFKEKYLERPKQFGQIAEILEKKSLNDCVLYYYMSKKTENFKQLLKKQVKRPPRRPQLKPSIRTSNEGQSGSACDNTIAGHTNCDANEQDVVRVTRPAFEDSKLNCCAACGKKLESYSVSHTVTKSTCSQFGLDPENFQPEWKVCATCAKLRRRKTKICPIPSCSSPHRRVRHLPMHWDQIPPEIKQKIRNELQMDEEVKRCCSSCYDKVADLLLDGDNDVDEIANTGGYMAKWSAPDINTFKEGIEQYGKQWQHIASMIENKSQDQCRMYFYRNKKRLSLDSIYNEYRKRKAEEGVDIELSDDSEDDDNVEDNDMSSDNEHSVAVTFPLNTLISKVEPTCSQTPIKRDGNSEVKPKISGQLLESQTMVNGDLNAEENLTYMKLESADMSKGLIKPEKVEHDSSATASADEAHSVDPFFLGDRSLNEKSVDNPLSKAMSFVKQEPGLMSNPDGMFPTTTSIYSTAAPNATVSIQHRPPSSQANTPSTSVKDLIDLAIEDALGGNGDATNSVVSERQSVISQCLPQNTSSFSSIHSKNSHAQPQDMRADVHSQGHNMSYQRPNNRTPSQNRLSGMDESLARRQAPLMPYESDPRAYIQQSKEKQQSNQHRLNMPGVIEGGPVRAPPPAHSHHLTPAATDIRNAADRKSPAAPFAMYDSKSNSTDRGISPHARQTIGQPPPLISSGMTHHLPAHLSQHMKKEAIHAGGSILHGTSASHAQQPSRFEGGSISHGTPRNQSEPKSLSQPTRTDDRLSRSPRTQPSMHSPALPSQPPHIEMLERQQQHLLLLQMQDAIRRGQPIPPVWAQLAASLPPAAYEPFQTKSVLQNDFLTAKQMSASPVTMPAGASAYSSALDKDKGGKASPHSRDSALLAGIPPQMMMMLMSNPRMMAPRPIAPDRPRLLGSAVLPTPVPPTTKDDMARSWTLVGKTPPSSRPEPPRMQKPSMIPKTVEMLQRPSESNRRSASPHAMKDNKTRYEKDIEEMKYRSLSERNHQEVGGHIEQSNYSHKANYKSLVTGVKHEDLTREKTIDREKAVEYRDRQFAISPYGISDESVHTSQIEGENRPQAPESLTAYSRAAGMHRSAAAKEADETAFVSKKLLEVSKVIQKEQLHKDAASLFSSSFEKDSHKASSLFFSSEKDSHMVSSLFSSSFEKDSHMLQRSSKYLGEEQPRSGLTTAKMIDAIINKQINNENTTDNANKLAATSASHQHTSVIVPPKKQSRPIQHSRSDTDITSYSLSDRLTSSSNEAAGASSVPPIPTSNGRGGHITLADKINEIITNDYKVSDYPDANTVHPYQNLDMSSSNSSTLQPYRVEDVEPISPPNAGSCQSRNSKYGNFSNNPAKVTMAGGRKHAGIRSLLGADNPNATESKPVAEMMTPAPTVTTAGMTLMDVLKNNIEEAIRHDSDLNAANGPYKSSLYGNSQQPYHSKLDENRDSGAKKRCLEAMLAPSSKRPALSPHRARSPEEVEMYPSSSNSSLTPHSSAYRTPVTNTYLNNSMYRSLNPSHYQQPSIANSHTSNKFYNPTNSPSKAPQLLMPNAAAKTGQGNPGFSHPSARLDYAANFQPALGHPHIPTSLGANTSTYHSQGNSSVPNSYPHSLSARSTSTDELVIDEGSNNTLDAVSHIKHGRSQSPGRSTMRSPGVVASGANRMSPIVGYHNNTAGHSNNRVSPIASAAAVTRTSPIASSQAVLRKSPITSANSNNRMSPGMHGSSLAAGSRPSSRQSPALSNRQSPTVTRQSPMDNRVKSPLTAVDSPTSRLRSDMPKHSSLSENNIPHALVTQKALDAARSLNSLGTLQTRPLLSEHYETLSDDERH